MAEQITEIGQSPLRNATRIRRTGWVILLLALAAAPFLLGDFRTFQLSMVAIYAIAILGLNLVTGYGGQFSMGHGAIYAIGAYTVAILMEVYGTPYWIALPVVPVVCFCFGIVFGLPALRLQGHYLAMATFALAVATPQILKHKSIGRWTNGVTGINVSRPEVPFGLPLSQDQWMYFVVMCIALLMFSLATNLVESRIGRAMLAIRENPIAAASMGVNTAYYKTMSFAVSAAYCGLAGGLSSIVVRYVAPDSFDLFFSINLLIGVVIGGFATIAGAVYGALFIMFVPYVAADVSKSIPWAIQGTLLIAFMYAMPDGVVGLLRKMRQAYSQARSTKTASVPVRNAER